MGCGSSKTVDLKAVHDEPNGGTRITNNNTKEPFRIGDRVHVRGYIGAVRFLGPTELGDGDWVGVELDKTHRQGNYGKFNETKYFTCKPKHGLFVRPNAVYALTEELDAGNTSKISTESIVLIQTRIRRVLAKIRLRKLQQRSGNMKLIDKHVMNAPAEEEKSVNRLSHYLTKPYEKQRDKAFAIYRWLTLNVSYDVDGFFGRSDRKNCSAEDVLVNKTSVCEGYAQLFKALGQAAGLEIHVIGGYAKGYGHKPSQQIQGTNHAWNALCIDGQWWLSDATWGAGGLGEDLMFNRRPNTHHFLMDPEYAIFDHFPADEKWQCLDSPVTKKTFEKCAVPSGPMYDMGIELTSHQNLHYDVDGDSIEMSFYCPGRKMIMMSKVKDSNRQALSGRQWAQMTPSGINQVKLRAQFPVKGNYTIDVFVKEEGSWTFGLSYDITASKGCGGEQGGFPNLASSFYDDGFRLISPLENIGTSSGKVDIKLECISRRVCSILGQVTGVDGSEKNIMMGNQTLCFAEKTEAGFTLKVDTPGPGTYLLNVFTQNFESDGKNPFLCSYYINNTEREKRALAGFPRLSKHFHSWGLVLVEPRENIDSPDGKATIRIKVADNVNSSDIQLTGNIKPVDDNTMDLLPNQSLCFTEENTDREILVRIDTPSVGIYSLNIFGTDKDKGSNDVWLCSYLIRSAAKQKRAVIGFPRLSSDFLTWGLELIGPRENIHSKDGKAMVTVKCPENITELNGYLKKAKETIHNCCTTATDNDNKIRTISVELPSQGLFTLNVFGKRISDNNMNTYLFSFTIKADKGAVEP